MPGRQHQNGGIGMGLGYANLLTGSRFALNRGTKTGGVLSVWSRSAQSHFDGREGVLSINGDVRTTMVGADYAKDRLMTGVSLARSRGPGHYSGEHGGNAASAMTGVYPWIGYWASVASVASEWMTVWDSRRLRRRRIDARPGRGSADGDRRDDGDGGRGRARTHSRQRGRVRAAVQG